MFTFKHNTNFFLHIGAIQGGAIQSSIQGVLKNSVKWKYKKREHRGVSESHSKKREQ